MSAPWQRLLPSAAGLWPAEAVRLSRRPGRAPSLLLLPAGSRPRMLVPSDVPAAHRMLHRTVRGRVQRAGQEALSAGQRRGALALLPLPRLVVDEALAGAAGIGSLVADHVPGARATGVLLGPPRANAKPVLQVFDADGATVAFGKVGHDDASAALVRHESEVLAALEGAVLHRVEVPRVLFAGRWNGQQVLLMSALTASQDRASSWQPPVEAMAEIACAAGVSAPVEASSSPFLADLAARVATAGGPSGARLRGLVAEVRDAVRGHEVVLGRWHGDWAPWNMALTGQGETATVQLWDWERSADAVPVGFDLVHFVLQKAFRDRADPTRALAAVLPAAASHLDLWYGGRPPVVTTVLLYLLEILERYCGVGEPTPQVRERLDVLHPMVTRLVTLPKEHPAHG